ncbi:uncharacterized protein [Misgurnus anguillicaudatus]|uniref:uncharacterized protein n=1 Tax=Misgurnus anguillicaudatus TaxID=75329 RepID=UPI003CCF6633
MVRILEVDEGESVDLKTKVTDIQRDDVIEWRFGETLVAQINRANNIFSTYDDDDDLFKDKLKLNPHTGDLTINDISEKHYGFYKLKITRDGKTLDRILIVSARGEREELPVQDGGSYDLKTDLNDIKRDLIEWRFGETLIAKIVNNIFSTYDGDDDLFRDKLKLNDQTGDLNIKDIREEHTGVYTLKIFRDGKTLYKTIIVFLKKMEPDSVFEGASVTSSRVEDPVEIAMSLL